MCFWFNPQGRDALWHRHCVQFQRVAVLFVCRFKRWEHSHCTPVSVLIPPHSLGKHKRFPRLWIVGEKYLKVRKISRTNNFPWAFLCDITRNWAHFRVALDVDMLHSIWTWYQTNPLRPNLANCNVRRFPFYPTERGKKCTFNIQREICWGGGRDLNNLKWNKIWIVVTQNCQRKWKIVCKSWVVFPFNGKSNA